MLRKRLFPRSISDFSAVVFLVLIIQVLYWFEVFLVLPLHYANNNFLYVLHCFISTYLLVNIVGNYVILYLTDTSIQGRFLPASMKPSWKFCEVCESITPPRSWHCNTCNTCILKRDHHCNFTACCIGHYNQRYFLMFLFYMCLSSIYCSYFNFFYLIKFTNFTMLGLLKLIFPLAILLFGTDFSLIQLYRLLCVISIIGMVGITALVIYHFTNVTKGLVMHESAKQIKDYDLGSAKENLKQVLGERWYLTLFSPFVISDLPSDGINWDTVKQLSSKAK